MSDRAKDNDAIGRKLFIGGLDKESSKESVQEYFEAFGSLEDCVVMKDKDDPSSGRNRGFGFVKYITKEDASKVLEEKDHVIDGKAVEVKMAVPKGKEGAGALSSSSARIRKLFLGGLSQDTTKAEAQDAVNELITKFSKHEGFAEVTINTSKETGKSRGFGFALIKCDPEDENTACDIVDDILKGQTYVKLNDRDVELKKAVGQDEMRRTNQSSGQYRGEPRGYGYMLGHDNYGRGGGGMDRMMMGRNVYENQMGRMPTGYGYPSYQDMYGYQQQMRGYAAFAGAFGSAASDSRYGYDSVNMTEYPKSWGSYAQSGSSYGPTRGSYGNYKDTRERGDGRPASYHPYTRRQ